MSKPTKAQIKKERSPSKLKKALKIKGFPNGKAPKGKEAHHKKPVSIGGKTTAKNIQVITKAKHKRIHKKIAKEIKTPSLFWRGLKVRIKQRYAKKNQSTYYK